MEWVGALAVIVGAVLAVGPPVAGEWRRSQLLERDSTILAALPPGEVRNQFIGQFEERAGRLVEARRRKAQPWTRQRVVLLILGLVTTAAGVAILVADAVRPDKSVIRQVVEYVVMVVLTVALLELYRRWVIRQARAELRRDEQQEADH